MLPKIFLSIAVSLALVVSPLSGQGSNAVATECRNAGPGDSSFSLGSQVDGRLFTICANSNSSTTFKKPKTKIKAPAVKQDPRVNPVGQVIFSTIRVGKNTRVVFRPVAPKASRSPNVELKIGQVANFNVENLNRFGATWVFGRRLGVRFTPVAIRFTLSDGTQGNSFESQHSFSAQGRYRFTALVTYAVAYRKLKAGEYVNKKKAKWVTDPGLITIAANPLDVVVGARRVSDVVLIKWQGFSIR